MAALTHLGLGLVFAHLAWLWFWLCGSLLRRPASTYRYNEDALLDIVLTTVTGIALTGLATFALGLFGAISTSAAAFAPVVLGIALMLRDDSPARAEFWTRRARTIVASASPGLLVVYGLAIVLAFPAVVPDNGSDATAFYLAQAVDYAQSHRLVVDPWFRFPYYPNNWVLIQTWPAVFALGALGQFISWLCGALTLFGLYGLIVTGARDAQSTSGIRGVRAIAIGGAFALVLTAMFAKVVDIGMIDVPSAMFFLATLIAAVIGVRETDSRALASLIVCAGFLVGVKVSFIALLPLFIVLCALLAVRATKAKRHFIIAVLALLAVSSPWYVRAFILSGDPIEPILNLRFHGVDPSFTREDFAAQVGDLKADGSPAALIGLPLQLFNDFKSKNVRDFGTTLIAVLLPIPLGYLGWAFFRRRMSPSPLLLTAAWITYGYGYWTLTSHLGRYALIFFPGFIAFIGMSIVRLTGRSVGLRYAGVLLMWLLAIPSPASWNETLGVLWELEIANVGIYYVDDNTWLELRSPAYPQIEDISHVLKRVGRRDLRVYMLGLGGAQYFFKLHQTTMIGDAFGPARFADLSRAILHDDLQSYIERLHIGAFIVSTSRLNSDPSFAGLPQLLRELAWRETPYPNSDWTLFTTPSIPAPRRGEGSPSSGEHPPD